MPAPVPARWRRRAGLATAAGLGLLAIAAGVSAGLETSPRWTNAASAAVIPEVLYLEEEVAKVATIARVNADIAREVTVDVSVDDLARRAGSAGRTTTTAPAAEGTGTGASAVDTEASRGAPGDGGVADGSGSNGGGDGDNAGSSESGSGSGTGGSGGAPNAATPDARTGTAEPGSGAGTTSDPAPVAGGGEPAAGAPATGGTGGGGNGGGETTPTTVPTEPKSPPDRGKPAPKDPKATVDAKSTNTTIKTQEDAP